MDMPKKNIWREFAKENGWSNSEFKFEIFETALVLAAMQLEKDGGDEFKLTVGDWQMVVKPKIKALEAE